MKEKLLRWLRNEIGFNMLYRHINGIFLRLDEQDKKIQDLEIEIRILKGIQENEK